MSAIPAGDGFGRNGITINDAGYVYRFLRPAGRVLIQNTGFEPISIGINEVLVDTNGDPVGTSNLDSGTIHTRDANGITVTRALAKAVVLWPNDERELEALVDPVSGRRSIISIWALCDAGKTSVMHGGVIGY